MVGYSTGRWLGVGWVMGVREGVGEGVGGYNKWLSGSGGWARVGQGVSELVVGLDG